jgi:hypothetical protein
MHLSKFEYHKKIIVRILRTACWALLKSVDYGNKCFRTGDMPLELE